MPLGRRSTQSVQTAQVTDPARSNELYKIKTIASLTGFNPTLLRAWERRYKLLVPIRTASGHRLYTQDDLRVLQRVRVLIDQGRSIGEVVAHGRQRLLQPATDPAPPSAVVEEFPELARLRQAVLEAALNLDEEGVERGLDRAFSLVSPLQALEHVLVPAARHIGRLWEQKQASVAHEHLLTLAMERRLLTLVRSDQRVYRYTAICCGLPDEGHQLGLLVTAYHLLQSGIRVIPLGASLPLADLQKVIEQRRPDFVMLSVTRKEVLATHRGALKQLLQKFSGGPPRFVLGGAAVSDDPELSALGVLLWPAARPLLQLTEELGLG